MTKAIIYLGWPHADNLPDHFKEDVDSGYACIGHIPTFGGQMTCLWVEVTDSVLDQMRADTDIVVVGEVNMAIDTDALKLIPVSAKDQADLRALAIGVAGVNETVVNNANLSNIQGLVARSAVWFSVPPGQVFNELTGENDG